MEQETSERGGEAASSVEEEEEPREQVVVEKYGIGLGGQGIVSSCEEAIAQTEERDS